MQSLRTRVKRLTPKLKVVEQLLGKQLLWLACRHHILELVVGAAFTELLGDTKSPQVTFFKTLTSWDSLSIGLPEIPPSYRTEKDELLNFVNTSLEPENLMKLHCGD
ncbi:hypothetical protein ACHWQZ_G011059 [Mnemiopsis leidyi]